MSTATDDLAFLRAMRGKPARAPAMVDPEFRIPRSKPRDVQYYYVRMAQSCHAHTQWAAAAYDVLNPWTPSDLCHFPDGEPVPMPPPDAMEFPTCADAQAWIANRRRALEGRNRPSGKYKIVRY